MILETLLTAALETGIGLLAEVGFGDAVRDLKDRLTNTDERQRWQAFERAFARAREAVGDDPITPLLEHRPFLEEVVKGLLDPTSGFNVQAAGEIWQERLPQHARALRQFFSDLEKCLFADDVWGPILVRYQDWRFRDEVRQALQARQLDISAQKLVHDVSLHLSGSGAIATSSSTSAGAGGVAVAGDVGQIVLQQIIMQSGARAHSSDLRQRYLARLHDLCCALPLAALGGDLESKKPVTLDQVYIELNTTTEVPADLLERIRQGDFGQWSAVQRQLRQGERAPLIDGEPRAQRFRERQGETRPLPVLEALRLSPQMALLGEAGAGKSTVARIVIARLIEGNPSPGVPSELLPILVVLRDLVPRLGTLDFNALPAARHDDALADAVRDQMLADLERLDASGFGEDLLEALNVHRCLLVFDGLDEVPQDLRALARKAVVAAIKRYRPPRIIVSCRTRSYVDEAVLSGFQAFTLAPFTDEQIDTFAHAWYNAQKALGHVDAMQAEARAVDLAQKALAPALRELAANPMLMTTMTIIHQQETRLPEERVRLYDKAVGLLLHRWQREKVEDAALAGFLRDGRRLHRVLERLGYEAHLSRPRGQPGESSDLSRHQAQDIIEEYLSDANQAREFLDYVDQRAGLLIGRGEVSPRPATYTFPHRTFQEYLAGCYMLTGSDNDRVRAFYARAAEGDRWNLVVQLAAEELLYNNPRNGEREVLHLAYNLLADTPTSQQQQRAALWSGEMALLADCDAIERDTGTPNGGQAYLQRLLPCMLTLLAGDLSAPERCQAGDILGYLGDPRFNLEAWYLPKDDLLGFVEIPAGPFLMGSDKARDPTAYDDELEQHEVMLPGYYIARYPVTVAQFRAFVEASGQRPDQEESLQGPSNHPVVDVTWYDARRYGDWLTAQLRAWKDTPEPLASLLRREGWCVTLPSEAEWEKAARGADGRTYPWGDEPDANRANYEDTGIYTTSAVGCFPGGASPYGVEELSGNVWEWTRSLWGPYPYPTKQKELTARENVDAPDNVPRVLRGREFYSDRRCVRCACRFRNSPYYWLRNIGFRVVVRPCR